MSTPQQWLDEILEATEALLQDETLNHQQVTFVEAIYSCAKQLNNGFSLIPINAIETNHIFSEIGHQYRSRVASIRGYSDLLLTVPTQFEANELSDLQKQYFVKIRDNGEKFRLWKLSLVEYAETYQQKYYKAPPQATNLNQFLEDYVPQYQYMLKLMPDLAIYSNVSVKLLTDIPPNLPYVMTNPYHLSYLLLHIIRTITELIEKGNIHLLATAKDDVVMITIASDALELTKDALVTLFEKQGHHIYRERLEAQGGKLSIPSASTIAIHLTIS